MQCQSDLTTQSLNQEQQVEAGRESYKQGDFSQVTDRKLLKMCLVSIEEDYIAVGHRRVSAIARLHYPDADVFYVSPTEIKSPDDMKLIARRLAEADMVCFSSVTEYSVVTKDIIAAVKLLKPSLYIIWGGVHPIIDPDDAIQHADAICTGEGETAFGQVLDAIQQGAPFHEVGNFWVREGNDIRKNDFLPLMTPEEMSTFPLGVYLDDEGLFKSGRGFVEFDLREYIALRGLFYTTVWSIGCPYRCTYCSNTRFIANDPAYRKLRHPSVRYLVDEIKHVLKRHPYLSAVAFVDDSFMAIDLETLEEFADLWKKEINMPFTVGGIIPVYVNEEKIRLLVRAGMVRVRMGIQSGSDAMLKFYKRPNKAALVKRATDIFGKFASYTLPPNYDIILDNPIETQDDLIQTLDLVYDIPRPFNLFLFSLREIPNTQLAIDLKELNVTVPDITVSYHAYAPTFANILLMLTVFVRIPRPLFSYLLRYVQPATVEQPTYPRTLALMKTLYRYRVYFHELRNLEISWMGGRKAFIFCKLGLHLLCRKLVMRRLSKVPDGAKSPTGQVAGVANA
ncbi:B12-binding domain-containing radical SAM protein [bacterium AH-315-O15]|nr:B12-binding domain-containing radical SAM protein [bacterium AH-315-O15]